jgi:hypothetical protein
MLRSLPALIGPCQGIMEIDPRCSAGVLVYSGLPFNFAQESRPMALEKEWIDRAAAISTAILQLRDSL